MPTPKARTNQTQPRTRATSGGGGGNGEFILSQPVNVHMVANHSERENLARLKPVSVIYHVAPAGEQKIGVEFKAVEFCVNGHLVHQLADELFVGGVAWH